MYQTLESAMTARQRGEILVVVTSSLSAKLGEARAGALAELLTIPRGSDLSDIGVALVAADMLQSEALTGCDLDLGTLAETLGSPLRANLAATTAGFEHGPKGVWTGPRGGGEMITITKADLIEWLTTDA